MSDEQIHLRLACTGANDFIDRFRKYCESIQDEVKVTGDVVSLDKVEFEGPLSDFIQSEDWTRFQEQLPTFFGSLWRSIKFRFVRDNPRATLQFGFVEFDGISIRLTFSAGLGTGPFLKKLYGPFEVITEAQSKASTGDKAGEIDAATTATNRLSELVVKLGEMHGQSIVDSRNFVEETTKLIEQTRTENELTFQAEVAEERGRLEASLAELSAKELDLNLRESRGVRRKLLDDIKTLAGEQKKFERSKETGSQERSITICAVGFMIFGVFLIIVSLMIDNGISPNALLKDPPAASSFSAWIPRFDTNLDPYLPFASGALLIASTGIFYLRHLRLAYLRSEDTDFTILQFHRDVLRMSWVTELVFEAKNNRSGNESSSLELPDVVLEQFTRSLFTNTRELSTAHPIDDLQQLARKFKRFSIGQGGVEVEAIGKEQK